MAKTKKKNEKRKNEKRKKKENRFYFKETYLKVFETQIYYPQFVPKSNTDQQKKKSPKRIIPPSSLFLLQKTEATHARVYITRWWWSGQNPRQRCRGGLGETPGGGAKMVWAKPQAVVQRWSG
jgi:hypothetical protein